MRIDRLVCSAAPPKSNARPPKMINFRRKLATHFRHDNTIILISKYALKAILFFGYLWCLRGCGFSNMAMKSYHFYNISSGAIFALARSISSTHYSCVQIVCIGARVLHTCSSSAACANFKKPIIFLI